MVERKKENATRWCGQSGLRFQQRPDSFVTIPNFCCSSFFTQSPYFHPSIIILIGTLPQLGEIWGWWTGWAVQMRRIEAAPVGTFKLFDVVFCVCNSQKCHDCSYTSRELTLHRLICQALRKINNRYVQYVNPLLLIIVESYYLAFFSSTGYINAGSPNQPISSALTEWLCEVSMQETKDASISAAAAPLLLP